MPNFTYPHNIQDIDNMAPITLIYDEYNKFQICHIRLGEDMNFVVLIKILDSRSDPDGTITLNGFELMVIHGFLKGENEWIALDTGDIVNNPPVSIFYSEKDEKHHGPLVNFKVKIKKTDPILLKDPVPVYYYSRPVKIRIGEKLHFVMDGIEEEKHDVGASQGRMCLVDTPVGKRWVAYEDIKKYSK